MKNRKLYVWGLALVVVALAGFALFRVSHPAARVAAAGQNSNGNAPVALAKSDPVPWCTGTYGLAALAHVNRDEVFCNQGFSNITHPKTGIYCLTLASPPPPSKPLSPQVSVEWAYSLGVALYAQYDSTNFTCGGSSQQVVEVRTYKGDTGGVGSDLQIPVLSDSVAFNIYVPLKAELLGL
jgi:hypothetical protein